MVKIASVALIVVAMVSGSHAAFDQICNVPYDTCGWILHSPPYNYDEATLRAATAAGGRNPDNSTLVYDALYSCDEGGSIEWLIWCGTDGCDRPMWGPNANCRNGPVWD